MDDAEVDELIEQRIQILKDRANFLYKEFYLHTDTAAISFWPIKNPQIYGLKTENKLWLINNLH